MENFFISNINKILITGGLGFIGSNYIARLLNYENIKIFNIDKFGYASDHIHLNSLTKVKEKYKFLKLNLSDFDATKEAIDNIKPDLIVHFAAETHVDRSIDNPSEFIQSNIVGTFNLLQASLAYYEKLSVDKRKFFKIHHVSTDEVFGSLGAKGFFNELTPYNPKSPYSASKASSDHLVQAWFHTYGLPILISNCSNNYGPWQFPEKLIPLVILKAISGREIPIYGDGTNIRDWLFIEDHLDALLLIASKGKVGEKFCIGGYGEFKNIEIVKKICAILDTFTPKKYSHSDLITFVKDRPGHDKRYSIDSSKITTNLGWKSNYSIDKGLEITIKWYLQNLDWCKYIMKKSGYDGQRIGLS